MRELGFCWSLRHLRENKELLIFKNVSKNIINCVKTERGQGEES